VNAPLLRVLVRGRPATDPRCAGCSQLALFRALRRAGLEVQGGSGCDEEVLRLPSDVPGRWAAVAGAARAAAGAGALVAEARTAGASLVAVADRDGPGERAAVEALARAGVEVVLLDGTDVAAVEAAVRAAGGRDAAGRDAAVVVLSACVRDAPRGDPVDVDPSRCNRCGACLSLGCPALSDPGGDAVAIERAVCTGCGLCVPLCRSRALS
jgi:TPP-dependent indolepyruvate ferredoxin oxidoreductase alpha subunit